MRRMVLKAVSAVLVMAALLWAGDFAVLKASHAPYGTVTVRRYYAVVKKANKVEFIFDSARDQPCVNSLFPHLGQPACWYLRRHSEERVTI